MKMFTMAAAAAMMTATGVVPAALAAPASAQRVVVHERTVVRQGPGRDRWRNRRACSTQWRHHHRVRVCRTVRYRY